MKTRIAVLLVAVVVFLGCSSSGSVGPPGPKGDAGPKGDQGVPGQPGANGQAGVSILSAPVASGGLDCPNGGSQFTSVSGTTFACNGSQGQQGIQGLQGIQGQQGVQGLKGDTGPSGQGVNLWEATQTSDVSVMSSMGSCRNFVDLPGTDIQFTSTGRPVALLGSGTATGVAGGSSVLGACCFRFVVDGGGLGDAAYGDRFLFCPTAGAGGAFMCAWTMQRLTALTAGIHTAKLQVSGYDPTTGCEQRSGNDAISAKLLVTAY